jgi:hypothetical protein
MKDINSLRKLLAILFFACLASCSKSAAPRNHLGARSVQELSAGCVALEQFAKDLPKTPVKNEFQRFAESPYNYTFEEKETDSSFIFTFTINPYQGRRVFGGVSAYEVSKSDMKVVRVLYYK